MKIYRDGDKLVKDTGKAPPQFRGVLSIVYAGTSPETVEESAYPADELRALPEVNIATLSQEWKEAFGLPPAESKSATGSQSPQPPERRATVDEETVPSPWREEYKEQMSEIWSSWPFIFTPVVVLWLPFTIMATVLFSVGALACLLTEDDFEFGDSACACALTALALSAYVVMRLA